MIALYLVLYFEFEFPESLQNESWRPLALGYSLYFIAMATIVPLLVLAYLSSLRVSSDIRRAFLVIPRILSVMFLYVILDIVFAVIYRIISLANPDAFNQQISGFVDALYFSTVTITTLGYGEIHPTSTLTKLLVVIQVIVGIVMLSAILSTSISVALQEQKQSKKEPDKE
jgi:hypothetical protein